MTRDGKGGKNNRNESFERVRDFPSRFCYQGRSESRQWLQEHFNFILIIKTKTKQKQTKYVHYLSAVAMIRQKLD